MVANRKSHKEWSVREQKAAEKQEKKERLKESVSETMDSAKSGLGKIFKKDRKAIEAEKGETIDE